MASKIFLIGGLEIHQGVADFQQPGTQFNADLCGAANDCEVRADDGTVTTIGGPPAVNLDPPSGGSYAAQTLASKVIAIDDTNNWISFDAANISFDLTGVTPPAGGYVGVLISRFITNLANSIPYFYIEFTNAPLSVAATQIDVPWNAAGIYLYNTP